MGVWKINLKFVNFVKAILKSFSTFASQIAWRRFGLRRSYGSNCSVNCFKLGFRTWCFQNWLRVLRTSLQKDVIVLILFAFGISRTDANSFTISHSNRWHCKSRSMENPRHIGWFKVFLELPTMSDCLFGARSLFFRFV